MIKGGGFPRRRRVAVFTGGTLTASMHIFLLMAADTGHGRALVLAINVACCTLHRSVLANQFESRQIMVKTGRFPGAGRVTGTAARAKRSLVHIILLMAANTTSRCALKFARSSMTGGTLNTGMRSGQFE